MTKEEALSKAYQRAHTELGHITIQRDPNLDNRQGSIIAKGSGWGDSLCKEMLESMPWVILGHATVAEVKRFMYFIHREAELVGGSARPGWVALKIKAAD